MPEWHRSGTTRSGEEAMHISEVRFSDTPADPDQMPSNARFDPETGENVKLRDEGEE